MLAESLLVSAGSSTPAALSIVVPTYNERDRLPDLVGALFDAYAAESLDGELIIVDDNSPDGTGRVADELAARRRIGVVHRGRLIVCGTLDELRRQADHQGTLEDVFLKLTEEEEERAEAAAS